MPWMKNMKIFKISIMLLVVLCLAGLALAESAQQFFDRGVEASENDNYDEAIADFTKALEIDPNYAKAYGNRGITYAEKGQPDEAIADFNKALQINPKDAEAYTYRGWAYAYKGQFDQAITDYNKAIEINPKLTEAYLNRGVAYAAAKGSMSKPSPTLTKP